MKIIFALLVIFIATQIDALKIPKIRDKTIQLCSCDVKDFQCYQKEVKIMSDDLKNIQETNFCSV